MGMFLGLVGFVGGLGCLIALIILAIKKSPKKKQWGATIGIAVFAVMFIIGVSMPSEDTNVPAQTAQQLSSVGGAQNQASNEPSITDGATKVDYKTLYKDYEDNAINADKKYRDKKLVLTGSIANIDRDISQSPYITFNVDEYGAKSIKMSFGDDDTVAALKKGQKVTVVGTCNGSFMSTIVTLSDCAIVK